MTPASDRPDVAMRSQEPAPAVGSAGDVLPEEELRALEETVRRVLQALEAVRSRAEEAEAAHEELREALLRSGADDPTEVEERLRRLGEENQRLRRLLEEGREKARRIRSRLILLEDES